jgi:hypothetical protein
MIEAQGRRLGRLHVSVNPGSRRQDGVPIFVMSLTARGDPTGDGLDGIQGFMEIAHEHIVRTFAELTTSAIHREWERDA